MKLTINYTEYDVKVSYNTNEGYWTASVQFDGGKCIGYDTTLEQALTDLARKIELEQVNCRIYYK